MHVLAAPDDSGEQRAKHMRGEPVSARGNIKGDNRCRRGVLVAWRVGQDWPRLRLVLAREPEMFPTAGCHPQSGDQIVLNPSRSQRHDKTVPAFCGCVGRDVAVWPIYNCQPNLVGVTLSARNHRGTADHRVRLRLNGAKGRRARPHSLQNEVA